MTHHALKAAGARAPSAARPASSRKRTSEHLSRRRLIGGALAVAAVPALPVVVASPDSALLEMAERLRAAWRVEVAVCARECTDAELEAATRICRHIADEIEGIQATTLAGLQVKALATSWCHNGEPFAEEDDTLDNRLVATLLDDLNSLEVTNA